MKCGNESSNKIVNVFFFRLNNYKLHIYDKQLT